MGPVLSNRLLEKFGNPINIYNADEESLKSVKGINSKYIENIESSKSLEKAEEILDKCKRYNISILTKENALYPCKAKNLPDAPAVLYYQGELKELYETVGIVGARRCSQEIKKKCAEITEKYVCRGMAVISGMAKGIDACAATVCINKGGYTIAILGNGLDICYPSEHRSLMDKIREKGLLLSEYPPGTKPNRYNFPVRNRLISAWSDEVIVIAPGVRSGSLITAEFAGKYERKVIFVPQLSTSCVTIEANKRKTIKKTCDPGGS